MLPPMVPVITKTKRVEARRVRTLAGLEKAVALFREQGVQDFDSLEFVVFNQTIPSDHHLTICVERRSEA